MGKKEEQIAKVAKQLFDQRPDWVTFFREILGVGGIVRDSFSDPSELSNFEQSDEYLEIQRMVAKLREASDSTPGREPTRVITVRLPASLHEALRKESHERRTSMNTLCITKLLQMVEGELVPTDRQISKPETMSLYFDLSKLSANDIATTISDLSEIYSEIGGDKLVIDGTQMVDASSLAATGG